MAGTEAFRVEAVVIESLSSRTCRVELANGHRLLAFVAGRTKAASPALLPGGKVKLQLTPFDLSSGRILIETK